MKSARRKPRSNRVTERLTRLLASSISPAELLELYYWAKEPGLLAVIRHIATMPEETRSVIEAFVVMARDTKSVSAELDGRGVLTLSSAEAARTITLARHAAAEDGEEFSPLLN